MNGKNNEVHMKHINFHLRTADKWLCYHLLQTASADQQHAMHAATAGGLQWTAEGSQWIALGMPEAHHSPLTANGNMLRLILDQKRTLRSACLPKGGLLACCDPVKTRHGTVLVDGSLQST